MQAKLSRFRLSRWPVQVLADAAIVLVSILVSASGAEAQQTPAAAAADNFATQQTADALKTLSGNAQAVIARLSKLNSIPLNDWRFHAGALPHGEAVDLDESSWAAIHAPFQSDTKDTVWFRTWIVVPRTVNGYDLTGTRIWISSLRDSDTTVYFNGQRVSAGDDAQPLVVFGVAKPGDKALVAIRLNESDDAQSLPAQTLQVDAAAGRPSPEDMYTECGTAALLIPDLAANPSADRALLERAIGDVDFQALDKEDQQGFDRSLRHAQKDLEVLKPLMQSATFHLTGNSHIDAAWLWPWTETVDVVKRTFGTALQLMDEYPDYTYTQSALQYNEWIAEKYPLMNAEIGKRIKEGRWEVVGGMWVEPDLNMPGGESLVRQLLIGQRTLKQLYGITTRVGWNPDSFGYNWQLPQIYKKSGIDYFVTQKLAANEINPYPFKLFWWESPDGSKVLTYFPHSYANDDLDPVRLANDFVRARKQSPGMLEMMDLYGVGDHGGGSTRAILDEGTRWMRPGAVVPEMKFGIAQSYFSRIEKKISPESPEWNLKSMAQGVPSLPAPPAGEVSIPTWKDELYFEHHRGTYTTQANQKRNMRESEEQLLAAEKYSSLAWLDGLDYPATELNEAWKKALFNQFHDLAAGSGIGIIYKDAQRDYDQVRWATEEASSTALHAIQANINTSEAGNIPVLVFNALGWQRSGLIKVSVQMAEHTAGGVSVLDSHNRVLPSKVLSWNGSTSTYELLVEAKDIPSLGYEVLHVVPGRLEFPTDLHASGLTLENTLLKVTVDPQTGCMTSLYSKADRFESLAQGACGNELEVFKDTPENDDAWNIDPGTLDHFTAISKADSVELVEQGPMRAVIRVARKWQSSTFVQDIVLDSGSDQVEVVNNIDWHETHTLLKAAFPLAASGKPATYEIPFGTIDRPTTRDNSWEQARFEVPALRWADLGNLIHGLSILNDSKYGYDCKVNVLRLTLLRSPVSPDPNADRGDHTFSYALYPHAGDWKSAFTIRHGYEFNSTLTAMQVQPHAGALPLVHSFVELKGEDVVLTAVKKAEDANGLILRFYEWAGKDGVAQIHVPAGAASATLTNLMEAAEGEPIPITGSDEITVPVHPYAIVSVRVDYPVDKK
jgi:alpha-mannosidase